jgi:hypothetical protein
LPSVHCTNTRQRSFPWAPFISSFAECTSRHSTKLASLPSAKATNSTQQRVDVLADDGLDLCLIVHVHDEVLTAHGGHHIRPGLISILTSEEILHTKTIYPYSISRMCNEYDIFYNIGRLTHSYCFTRSTLLLNSLSSRSTTSGAMAY